MYRLQVIGTSEQTVKKGRKFVTKTIGVAWDDWNRDERMARKMGRPGFGSFHYATGYAAFRRARVILKTQANVSSVQIRGIRGQMIGRLFREQMVAQETPLLAIARLKLAA